MRYLLSYDEVFEKLAIHKDFKKENLPYCSVLQNKGYLIIKMNDVGYAFNKNFDLDDEVYWLGKSNENYMYGNKYLVTYDVLENKNSLPFYSLYCKCDDGLTDAEKKMKTQRLKEFYKKNELRKKEFLKKKKLKKK